MSGEGVQRSIWIIILPLMFMFAMLILLVIIPAIGSIDMFSGFNFEGIGGGVSQILPLMGVGIGIGMLFLVFAIISRRRR